MDNLHMDTGTVSRALKIALVIALSAALLVTVRGGSAPAQAQTGPPLPPPEKRIGDLDGNKIFDDLEFEIAPAAASDPFRVILLLTDDLERLNAPLRQQIGDFKIGFSYPSIDGFSTTLTKGQIESASRLDLVKQIERDAIVRPDLDTAKEWFGVDQARLDFLFDGNTNDPLIYNKDDIVIAVLDTGINNSHVDLDGGKVILWKDFINGLPDPYDEAGCSVHGSHVSSIAAGAGDGDAALAGVAPGAALVVGKVLGVQQGSCFGFTSQVNAGIQWVIDNKTNFGIDVMNMSLGGGGCSDGTDSQSVLVNATVAAGIVAVLSAGNAGPGNEPSCTIASPAAAADAITVAAMADVEPGTAAGFGCGAAPGAGFYLVCFSGRGPTLDGRIKPDIAGPGVFIKAADGETISGYKELSGTSMSSPFTAGVAALMRQANPSLTPAQIKTMLMGTAVDWGVAGDDINYGAGRLDAYQAIKVAALDAGPGIDVPAHRFISGNLAEKGDEVFIPISVSVLDTSFPIAVTMIMDDNPVRVTGGGQPRISPDFDIELRDPGGTLVAASRSTKRQETIGVFPVTLGNYELRVFSFNGSGDYIVDISAGIQEPIISISLATDGTVPFGIQELGTTVDTTASGTGDVQVVSIFSALAALNIRSTDFSDGSGNIWSLDTTASTDKAVWQFSTDGMIWNTFVPANNLTFLSGPHDAGETQGVFFRLKMPTGTTSVNEHGATVTIVAIPP